MESRHEMLVRETVGIAEMQTKTLNDYLDMVKQITLDTPDHHLGYLCERMTTCRRVYDGLEHNMRLIIKELHHES